MDWFTFLIPISWSPACDFLLSVGGVFYCLAAALGSQGDIVARIGFHRQRKECEYSDRDKQVVNILLPHMAKAIHNRNLMHRVELSKEPGGVIAIGEDGNHFFVNDMAKRLLKGIPWQKRFFKVHGKGKNPRSPKAGLRGNPMLPT